MAKFKGAKWAQLLTLMAAIAASIISGVSEAKTYAKNYSDGLKAALVAGDIAFTNANFNSGAKTDVGAALGELYTAITGSEITVDTTTTTTGMLRSYKFKKGGSDLVTIDIPKDYVNNIIGIVSQDGSGNAGVFLKVNTAPTGADSPIYDYVDVSGLVEYITVGTQTNKPVQLTIDANHQITADIPAGAIQKSHLAQEVQDALNASSQKLEVSDIQGLTATQLDGLNTGDIVVKITGNKKHAYTVAYKDATAGEISLVYCDHETIEEVYYEKVDGTWTFTEKADMFEWASDSDVTTAWANAMSTAAAAAAGE